MRFDDCSLIHLNPSAGSYVLHGANGTTTNRGLCATATSFIAERLRLALHLRNTLTSAAPRVFWDLLPPSFRYFDLDDDSGLGLGPISWPRKPSAVHVLRHADGAIRVLSLDRRAWLLLHPERHTFCVCFPQCAGPVDDMPAGTLDRLRAAAVLERTAATCRQTVQQTSARGGAALRLLHAGAQRDRRVARHTAARAQARDLRGRRSGRFNDAVRGDWVGRRF